MTDTNPDTNPDKIFDQDYVPGTVYFDEDGYPYANIWDDEAMLHLAESRYC